MILIFGLSFFGLHSHAQEIRGVWTGVETSEGGLARHAYVELDLEQVGERVTGTSLFRISAGNYALFSLEGWIHEGVFEMREVDLLDEKLMSGFQWCWAEAKLFYSCQNGLAILKGSYTSTSASNKDCAGGHMVLRRKVNCGEIPAIGSRGLAMIDSSGQVYLDTITRVSKGHTLQVKSPVLTIHVKDDYQYDKDTISLMYNGKPLFLNVPVKRFSRKYDLVLDMESPFHYLTFHAVNLGEIPPNTASIVIDDGYTGRKVQISSSKQQSDIIYLDYKP